jgi:quercetin dioxygenase-like cupin family protein
MSRFRQAALCATVLMTIATLAAAAPPAVHKTTMEDQPFPAPYHTITVRTVIATGGDVAPHTHPGLEMAYIVSGRAAFSLAGQAPLMLRAGDTVAVPEGRVHSVHNAGRSALIILSTYVVKVGEPIASPSPATAP